MKSDRLYWQARGLARLLLPRLAPCEVSGLEKLPQTGPALLLPNHQSALDPIFLQAWAPRRVRSMTKSTQFSAPLMPWALPRLGAFPVRRFRVDGQSVRVTMRLLEAGEWVCIYPEGERSWDARIDSFRRGTLRVALAAMERGIPVYPVGLSGLFQVLPRWDGLQRSKVPMRMHVGEPLRLESPLGREHRASALLELEARLRTALVELSGEGERPVEPWPFS